MIFLFLTLSRSQEFNIKGNSEDHVQYLKNKEREQIWQKIKMLKPGNENPDLESQEIKEESNFTIPTIILFGIIVILLFFIIKRYWINRSENHIDDEGSLLHQPSAIFPSKFPREV